jgi:hypothetical protein
MEHTDGAQDPTTVLTEVDDSLAEAFEAKLEVRKVLPSALPNTGMYDSCRAGAQLACRCPPRRATGASLPPQQTNHLPPWRAGCESGSLRL